LRCCQQLDYIELNGRMIGESKRIWE
jgi:hypothetical protein